MSSGRVTGGGGIPAGSKKMVQSLKEIVSCSEAEIYAALKDCNMDPNEAVNRLLSQGTCFAAQFVEWLGFNWFRVFVRLVSV